MHCDSPQSSGLHVFAFQHDLNEFAQRKHSKRRTRCGIKVKDLGRLHRSRDNSLAWLPRLLVTAWTPNRSVLRHIRVTVRSSRGYSCRAFLIFIECGKHRGHEHLLSHLELMQIVQREWRPKDRVPTPVRQDQRKQRVFLPVLAGPHIRCQPETHPLFRLSEVLLASLA